MYKKSLRFAAAIAGTGALLFSTLPAAQAAEVENLAGKTRYQTSIEIAKHVFPNGARSVYLARGDVLVDALSAGTLTDGPILLVNTKGDVSDTAAAVDFFNPQEVVALGGTKAISDEILNKVSGVKGSPQSSRSRSRSRVNGLNRYATSVNVALREWGNKKVETVYIANGLGSDGNGSPDALAGGSLTDGPVIAIDPYDKHNARAIEIIKKFNPKRVVALGGKAVVTDQLLAKMAGNIPTSRIGGQNRFETAAQTANAAFPACAEAVYFARENSFADSVSAGMVTAGPVMLAPREAGPAANYAQEWVSKCKPRQVFFIGGDALWTQGVKDQIVKGSMPDAPRGQTVEARIQGAIATQFQRYHEIPNAVRFLHNPRSNLALIKHDDDGYKIYHINDGQLGALVGDLNSKYPGTCTPFSEGFACRDNYIDATGKATDWPTATAHIPGGPYYNEHADAPSRRPNGIDWLTLSTRNKESTNGKITQHMITLNGDFRVTHAGTYRAGAYFDDVKHAERGVFITNSGVMLLAPGTQFPEVRKFKTGMGSGWGMRLRDGFLVSRTKNFMKDTSLITLYNMDGDPAAGTTGQEVQDLFVGNPELITLEQVKALVPQAAGNSAIMVGTKSGVTYMLITEGEMQGRIVGSDGSVKSIPYSVDNDIHSNSWIRRYGELLADRYLQDNNITRKSVIVDLETATISPSPRGLKASGDYIYLSSGGKIRLYY